LSAADIRVVDPLCAEALELLRAAALEARALYPDLIPADAPLPTNAPHAPGCIYLVAYDGERPVGMGALRPMPVAAGEERAPGTAEVRRMFVEAAYRRRGVGRSVLSALERRAATMGYRRLVLETGNRQTPAIALYEASGFRSTEPFGPYEGDPLNRCFEKVLRAQDASRADAMSRGRAP
jgi:GNAT superfamily N-acetyltransferase